MAETLVAAELFCHAPVPDEAEAQCTECRRQHGRGDPDHNLRPDHPGQGRMDGDRQAAGGNERAGEGHKPPLLPRRIDQHPDWHLAERAGDAADRESHPDIARAPVTRAPEEYREKRAEAVLHVGHRKV
jgi:hypothetical protein